MLSFISIFQPVDLSSSASSEIQQKQQTDKPVAAKGISASID